MEGKRKSGRKSIARRNMKMRKGIVLLSSIVFLLLFTSYADAETCPDGSLFCCNNCHTEKTCGHAACDSCHGNPPTKDVVDRNDKGGLIWYPAPTGSTSSGAHLKHATLSGMNYSCSECHYNGMQTPPVQLDSKIEIGFTNSGKGGGNYDGRTTLNPPYDYQGTNDTAITRNGTLACSNTYCHSNVTGGTKNAGGISRSATLNKINDPRPVAPGTSPAWSSSGPIGCTACHGYPPSYQTTQPKANSHHHTTYNPAITCATCHYATTHDGVTISDLSKHGNGIYEVTPGPMVGWPPVTFTYTYDAGGGKCTNVSCHGGDPYVGYWGSTIMSSTGVGIYLSTKSGTECFQVEFTASNSVGGTLAGPPPYMYEWDFGDGTYEAGTSSTLPITSTPHTYAAKTADYMIYFNFRNGNYRINNPSNGYIPASFKVTNPYPPQAYKTVSVSGMSATLTDKSYDPDYNFCGHVGPGSITITWGDNTTTQEPIDLTNTASNKVYNHTYDAAGSYTIHHCVTDNLGATKCSTDTIITVPK